MDATIEAVVRRIAATLEQPFGLRGGEIRVHASIGWSVFPFESDDPRTLLRLADEAMYRRKRGPAPLPSIGATS